MRNIPVINNEELLSSLNIEAYLRLIKLNYNTINGLCHPTFYSIRESLQENYDNSIFVINTIDGKGYHWLVITNIGCEYLHWRVFDSLDLPVDRYKLLFSSILPNIVKIKVTKENVAKQIDGKNCGLFSLANTLALAQGINPSNMEWLNVNDEMRQHYRECIDSGEIEEFPHKPRRALRSVITELKLN